MIEYSIVIVTYDSMDTLGACLSSVEQCCPVDGCEIIVVDNGSTDGTREFLTSRRGIISFLSENNLGFAAACNLGAEKATGRFLFFLNPDTLLTPGCLGELSRVLDQVEGVAVTGPVSNYAAGLQGVRWYTDDPPRTSDPANRLEVAEELRKSQSGKARESKLLIGFALMMKRELFFEMGKMDSELVLGLDDLDLCWRLGLMKKKLAVVPSAFVWHRGQVSFNAAPSEQVRRMTAISQKNFSAKLAAHYGSFEKIPPSRDLWGMDWFTADRVEVETKVDNRVSSNPILSWVVQSDIQAGENEEERKVSLRCTLESLSVAGVCPENIVLVSEDRGFEELKHYYKHSLNFIADESWKSLAERSVSLLGASPVFLLAGFALPRLSLQSFVDMFCEGSGGCGPWLDTLKNVRVESQGVWLDLNSSSSLWPAPALVLPPDGETRLKAFDGCLVQRLSGIWPVATASDEPEKQKETEGDELPESLAKHLAEFSPEKVAFWGRGSCLGSDGTPVDVETVDVLVMRLHLEDMPGLFLRLRKWRQAGLKKIVAVFRNGFFQDKNSDYANRGPSPIDLRRELQLAGFCISDSEAFHPEEKTEFLCEYGNNNIDPAERREDEQLWAMVPELVMTATACGSEFSLHKKVTVVMLALNKLEYTKMCIESLQKNCRQELELILVDNGSTDGTGDYFDSISGAKVIRNPKNMGVATGWNQGLREVTGDYVLILNNDTIIAPDTIENLVRAAENHPGAGIVAPRSNQIAGPQKVDGFEYDHIDDIPALAEKLQKENDLAAWEFSRIKGFCLLMPTDAVRKVGEFDEVFGIGNFEDDDWSVRMTLAGYRLLVADDSFLFHFGSVSFGQADIDWTEQMVGNQKIFNEKWKNGRRSLLASARVDSRFATAWKAIEEGRLEDARQTFFSLGDQLVQDGEACEGLAEVYRLEEKPKDAFTFYVRCLELDWKSADTVDRILHLLENNYSAKENREVLETLARRFPQLDFKENSAELAPNTGWQGEVEKMISQEAFPRAAAFLMERLDGGEESFEIYNYLGIISYYRKEYDEAFRLFEHALRFCPADTDTLLNLYDAGIRLRLWQKVDDILSTALAKDSELDEVRQVLEELRSARRRGDADPESLIFHREMNISAENLLREGLLEQTEKLLEKILGEDPANYRAWNNLGLVAWYRQERKNAWNCFIKSIDSNPWYVDAVLNLCDAAWLLDRKELFLQILEAAEALYPGHAELARMREELSEGLLPERLEHYMKGADLPESDRQLQAAAQLVEDKDYNGAVTILTALLEREPQNAEAYNALGVVAWYWKNIEDAYHLFATSLSYRPLDRDTLTNYWDAARVCGRENEARIRIRNAAAMDPALTDLVESIEEESR